MPQRHPSIRCAEKRLDTAWGFPFRGPTAHLPPRVHGRQATNPASAGSSFCLSRLFRHDYPSSYLESREASSFAESWEFFKKYCWAMPVASFVVLPAFHGTSYYIACEEIFSK